MRPGKHSVLADLKLGVEARGGTTGHQCNRCYWNCLAQLIKCSVLSYMVARLIPGVGRVLTHLLQSCPVEHSWEQIPSPVALSGATIYFVVPGGGCMQ